MKARYIFTVVSLSLAVVSGAFAAPLMSLPGESRKLKAYYYEGDHAGWDCVEAGKVVSVSMRDDTNVKDVSNTAMDRTRLSARLYTDEGIRVGDILYVINDSNLIIGKLEVKSVFNSASLGPMLVGYGNFKFVHDRDRVVQRIEGARSKDAYIQRARGDFYRETGDDAEAISSYKSALEKDKGNPEAHMQLGIQYLKDNMLPLAFREFSEAYKNISRMYDKEDRYTLLKSLAETRYREAYYSYIKADLREKYVVEGIKYCKEALQVYPGSKDVNFFIGTFYCKNSNPDDVLARDHLMKVVQLDPHHVDAYVMLSELYYKHRNKKKAREFSGKALEIEPEHERARYIYKNTETE